MPLKAELIAGPRGRVIVSEGHQAAESLTILPADAEAAGRPSIFVATIPRSQES